MVATAITASAPVVKYSTTGTVSSPLDLSQLRGEHTAVDLSAAPAGGSGSGSTNGNAVAKGGKKDVRPKVKVTLTSLTPNNSGTLRKINSVVIPIVYSDKFYKDVLDPTLDDINKLIYYADIPVGAICCRFENLSKGSKEPPTLVVLTLAILAPYRSLSLGSSLVLSALKASLHPTTPPPPIPSDKQANTRASLAVAPPRQRVNRALAHVQVGNEEGKRFYERLGFKQAGIEDNYYTKVEPRGALIMVCDDIATAIGEGETSQNGSS